MRVRRQAELLPDSGVKLPCLSARNQSFIDISFGQIEPLRECHRFGVGRPPKIVEKLSHNFATTLEFLLVGSIFGLGARLVPGPDHDTLGAGCQAFEFLLVGSIFGLSARLVPGPDHDTFGAGCQAFEFLLVGTSSVLMLVWLSGRTSAPDAKPPPAVLLSVLGRDLPLPGPASVLMNSIPIVTQLDIFEPRQETKGAVTGGWNLRLRNLRGVHPRIIRGWRAGLEATP